MLVRRLLIGAAVTVASLVTVPAATGVAGAASCGSTSGTPCDVTPTIAGSTSKITPSSALPFTGSTPGANAPVDGSPSSLPFTGADVEELAIIGVGGVLAGSLLMRRRRRAAA